MIRYLRDRLVDGAAALLIITILFEGPSLIAIAKRKLAR
jgi:hypothetical protein